MHIWMLAQMREVEVFDQSIMYLVVVHTIVELKVRTNI
jgi:hypothetical protein